MTASPISGIEIDDFEPCALLKVYYCFPYDLNGYEDNFGYIGFIKDITVYKDEFFEDIIADLISLVIIGMVNDYAVFYFGIDFFQKW